MEEKSHNLPITVCILSGSRVIVALTTEVDPYILFQVKISLTWDIHTANKKLNVSV